MLRTAILVMLSAVPALAQCTGHEHVTFDPKHSPETLHFQFAGMLLLASVMLPIVYPLLMGDRTQEEIDAEKPVMRYLRSALVGSCSIALGMASLGVGIWANSNLNSLPLRRTQWNQKMDDYCNWCRAKGIDQRTVKNLPKSLGMVNERRHRELMEELESLR